MCYNIFGIIWACKNKTQNSGAVASKGDFIMIKVDVISGFLGAGKTTLIKKLYGKVFSKEKVALIEN